MILKPALQPPSLHVTWDKLPDDFILPDDPVENILQPYLAAALTEALDTAGLVKTEMLIASNFGLVATVNDRTVVKAPDWVYVPQVYPVSHTRRSYTQHLEGGAIAIVMEFLSDTETGEYSSRPIYPYGKLYYYEQVLKVPTYVIFDAATALLEVRRLENGKESGYVLQTPDSNEQYWIPELNLNLGIWQGERAGLFANWLRWWDQNGNLLLWGAEKIAQERQRAEQERQRAEQERQRAEQEYEARVSAVSKLLGMGLSTEQVAEALSLSTDEIHRILS